MNEETKNSESNSNNTELNVGIKELNTGIDELNKKFEAKLIVLKERAQAVKELNIIEYNEYSKMFDNVVAIIESMNRGVNEQNWFKFDSFIPLLIPALGTIGITPFLYKDDDNYDKIKSAIVDFLSTAVEVLEIMQLKVDIVANK